MNVTKILIPEFKPMVLTLNISSWIPTAVTYLTKSTVLEASNRLKYYVY